MIRNIPIYTVRITVDDRAVGIMEDTKTVGFRIGSHTDYDQILKDLQNTTPANSAWVTTTNLGF